MKHITLALAFTFVALAQQRSVVPIVLVDDYDFLGKCAAPRDATTNFGQLAALLAQDSGKQPLYYDYCQQLRGDPGNPVNAVGITSAMGGLDQFLAKNVAGDGPIDVIAYGAGGLFVRTYLAGGTDPGISNPLTPLSGSGAMKLPIRKLVLIGSPNFGITDQSLPPALVSILTGFEDVSLSRSSFLWKLNLWNQGGDDLRGVDAIAIAGNGGIAARASDGLVSVNSASVGFAFPDGAQRTRVINAY